MSRALGVIPLLLAVLQAAGAASAQPPPRQSGRLDMSLQLQTLQADTGLNPAWLWIEQGRALWSQPGQCVSCHGPLEKMAGVAARFPKWSEALQRPQRLQEQVAACMKRPRKAGAAQALPPKEDEVLSLTAALVAAADGQPIAPDGHPAMEPWRSRGQAVWQQRMGQLNLSCAQCHDQRAGQRLGGTRIPQGHDTGYPLYRMEWQGMGTLARRIRGCLVGVRAEPYAEEADDLRALEVFLRGRSAGLPLEAGALRP